MIIKARHEKCFILHCKVALNHNKYLIKAFNHVYYVIYSIYIHTLSNT